MSSAVFFIYCPSVLPKTNLYLIHINTTKRFLVLQGYSWFDLILKMPTLDGFHFTTKVLHIHSQLSAHITLITKSQLGQAFDGYRARQVAKRRRWQLVMPQIARIWLENYERSYWGRNRSVSGHRCGI